MLIPKGENDITKIENFRGITLNNVDLKIFSKMLHFRLSPYLEEIIHHTQYARKGQTGWELNCLIRDLYQEMQSQTDLDSYLVRVDFQKAFDCVDMNYLYTVMTKMGIPSKFVGIIKALDADVSAKLLINGAKSCKIAVKRGTRQGDPLSMDKFIIALNPLLVMLNSHDLIKKYKSKSNKEFLTLAIADDLTIVTSYITSLLQVKHHIQRFGKASGLEINIDKTKGFFFNKLDSHQILHLPFKNWNSNMLILGIPFGSPDYIKEVLAEKYKDFEKEVNYFQSYIYLTLQAKAIISKSKILPKISYVASTLPLPSNINTKIDDRMVRFIVPHLTKKKLSKC